MDNNISSGILVQSLAILTLCRDIFRFRVALFTSSDGGEAAVSSALACIGDTTELLLSGCSTLLLVSSLLHTGVHTPLSVTLISPFPLD